MLCVLRLLHHLDTALSHYSPFTILPKRQKKDWLVSNKWGLLNRKMLKGSINVGEVDGRYIGGGSFFWAGRYCTCSRGHLKWEMLIIFSRATDSLEHLWQTDSNMLNSPFNSFSNMCPALSGTGLSVLHAQLMETGQGKCPHLRFIGELSSSAHVEAMSAGE